MEDLTWVLMGGQFHGGQGLYALCDHVDQGDVARIPQMRGAECTQRICAITGRLFRRDAFPIFYGIIHDCVTVPAGDDLFEEILQDTAQVGVGKVPAPPVSCTAFEQVSYKAWTCRERHKGRKGNGCTCRTIRETDLLASICVQMGWEKVTEEKLGEIERVMVSDDGVEIVKKPEKITA